MAASGPSSGRVEDAALASSGRSSGPCVTEWRTMSCSGMNACSDLRSISRKGTNDDSEHGEAEGQGHVAREQATQVGHGSTELAEVQVQVPAERRREGQ